MRGDRAGTPNRGGPDCHFDSAPHATGNTRNYAATPIWARKGDLLPRKPRVVSRRGSPRGHRGSTRLRPASLTCENDGPVRRASPCRLFEAPREGVFSIQLAAFVALRAASLPGRGPWPFLSPNRLRLGPDRGPGLGQDISPPPDRLKNLRPACPQIAARLARPPDRPASRCPACPQISTEPTALHHFSVLK